MIRESGEAIMAESSKGSKVGAAALTSPGYLVPFITVTALFFVFGFITTLNMALVPDLRNIFNLPYGWAMLAESAFFLAYFVFSSPSSKLIEWIGYKQTMVVSLFIQVVGCALFIPAAKLVNFPLFLTAVFIVGAGVTALQTSANPYAAILGPEETAPARLTLAQAFNSIGATIAPIVGGIFFLSLSVTTNKAAVANGVRGPYIAIAAGLFILGLAVIFSHLPAIPGARSVKAAGLDPSSTRSIWSNRHTVLGALGIFLYVGVEVGLASIGVNYFLSQGIDGHSVASFFASLGGFGAIVTKWLGPWSAAKVASILVSLYWFGALVGRLLGSWMLTKIKAQKLLCIFGLCASALVILSMFSSGEAAVGSMVLCGFFNSIMFPNIFALGIAGLGPMTSKGSGLIMTAVVGGAVVPWLLGRAADFVGIQHAFVIPLICYLYIAWYGLSGSKPGKAATSS
jgi:FHS family L-fucose permease-like MFS transporter